MCERASFTYGESRGTVGKPLRSTGPQMNNFNLVVDELSRPLRAVLTIPAYNRVPLPVRHQRDFVCRLGTKGHQRSGLANNFVPTASAPI